LAELREQGGLVNNSVSLLETNEQKVLPFELKLWNEASFLSNQAGLDALL
ncbi:histidine phosphatase family protein, partial [Listeria monocytogenes]|nr:histidine phosphatase family protein [Listeria monocytogenes]